MPEYLVTLKWGGRGTCTHTVTAESSEDAKGVALWMWLGRHGRKGETNHVEVALNA